jgi:hypothetical protein
MKRWAPFLAFPMLLWGCGQNAAPQNPLGPGMPPAGAAASCASQMNFEAPGSIAMWTAPTWAHGNPSVSGWPQRVSNQAECGQWSMETTMQLTSVLGTYNGNNAILFCVFPTALNFDGKTVSLYVYFSPSPSGLPSEAPPADLGVTLQFEDLSQNWVPTSGNQPFLGLKAGWNLLQRHFYGSQVQQVQALNIQISTGTSGVSYAGYMWVDEINW